jgi:FkbM family methyltransferase
MASLLNQIKDAPNQKMADLQALHTAGNPLIMYGAGSYAADVTSFLTRNKLEVVAYGVDRAYAKPDQIFMGNPVMSVDVVLQKFPDHAVVIGFADYEKARAALKTLEVKVPVYFFDAPNQMDFFKYSYVKAHIKEFEDSYAMLDDQVSRDIFIAFVNAKISANPSGLYQYANFVPYFSEPITLTEHESFVDCGAYDGDTIESLLKHTQGKYDHIFAFEPDDKNYKKLKEYIGRKCVERIEMFKLGCWSTKDVLKFSAADIRTSVSADGEISAPVNSIDIVVKNHPVTYIKMDIEGAELEALHGAAKTIKANHPKLAICAYHKPEDIITLPQYIKSLEGSYKLYLRHHQFVSWDMVLYAI